MPDRPEPERVPGPEGGSVRVAAILDLLLTVAYVDGQYHPLERAFVEQYLESVLLLLDEASPGPGADAERGRIGAADARISGDHRTQFGALYQRLDAEVAKLSVEAMSSGDGSYVPTRLKVRAVTIFRALAPAEQVSALELVRALMHADRVISAPEQILHDELMRCVTAPSVAAPASRPTLIGAHAPTRPMVVGAPQWNPLKSMGHPLLDPLEQAYSPHPMELAAQAALDHQLVLQAMAVWQRLRAPGHGRLAGITDIADLPLGARFLDRHVHVMRPDRPVELVVLGDLHGCYSCLKAALLQSDFINRAWAHQWDPGNHPDIKLVLLGDYIDRGRFSFDGVLRTVLQLLVAMPDQVIVLRGNHEYFLTAHGHTISGVQPAEALASIAPHVPQPMLEAYRLLFEHMPTTFLCERTLFVHGGVPRDDTMVARYRDLSSLNHAELRFQMLWSDPAEADHIPVELQRQNARFSFGREQFRAFMERLGVHTMVRGHEQIDRGFDVIYDLGDRLLLNLFSAGGHDNRDLPVDAAYRSVTPMALTIQHGPGTPLAIPWPIEYQPFNFDTHNGFHRVQPLLEFRYA